MTPVRVVAAQIFILLLFICHVIISCFQVTTAEVCKHFLARLSCKAKFKPRTPHFYQSLTIKKTSKLNFSEIKVNISISTRFGIFTNPNPNLSALIHRMFFSSSSSMTHQGGPPHSLATNHWCMVGLSVISTENDNKKYCLLTCS